MGVYSTGHLKQKVALNKRLLQGTYGYYVTSLFRERQTFHLFRNPWFSGAKSDDFVFKEEYSLLYSM
jgi:hypothetical protein